MADKISKPDSEWKAQLSDEEFYITRQKGTERAFTGKFWNSKDKGRVFTPVNAVVPSCLILPPSMIPAVAGPASINL